MNVPEPVDLVIDARYVVPVEPAGTLVDHALVVDAQHEDARELLHRRCRAVVEERDRAVRLAPSIVLPGEPRSSAHGEIALLASQAPAHTPVAPRDLVDRVPVARRDHVVPVRLQLDQEIRSDVPQQALRALERGIFGALQIKLDQPNPREVLVRDHGSETGTRLNGQILVGERALEPGDVLRLGDTLLVYAPAPPTSGIAEPEFRLNTPPLMNVPPV